MQRPSTRPRAPVSPSSRSRAVPTVFDHHYVFPREQTGLIEAEVQAARELGVRIVASRGSMDLGVSAGGLPPDELVEDIDAVLADTERLVAELHEPGRGARVQIAVAPCSPFSVTGRLMEESAELARDLGLLLHTHLAETVEEEAYCQQLYGCTPVEYLERLDWLAPDVWCAHCVHLSAADIQRFGETDTGVAHCPTSNLRLGAGVAPVRDLLDADVRVGLGVDGSASNERSDLFLEVKQALLVARGRGGGESMTAREALQLGHPRRRGSTRPRRYRLAGARQAGGLRRLVDRRSRAWRRRGSRRRARLRRPASGRPARRRRRERRARRGARAGRRRGDCPSAPNPGGEVRVLTASLSTHVLDTAAGKPAEGVRVELLLDGAPVAGGATDADGRLRLAQELVPGTYALVFHPPSPFFSRVELQLELGEGHHHVPLLVSPYGCASYRGS